MYRKIDHTLTFRLNNCGPMPDSWPWYHRARNIWSGFSFKIRTERKARRKCCFQKAAQYSSRLTETIKETKMLNSYSTRTWYHSRLFARNLWRWCQIKFPLLKTPRFKDSSFSRFPILEVPAFNFHVLKIPRSKFPLLHSPFLVLKIALLATQERTAAVERSKKWGEGGGGWR